MELLKAFIITAAALGYISLLTFWGIKNNDPRPIAIVSISAIMAGVAFAARRKENQPDPTIAPHIFSRSIFENSHFRILQNYINQLRAEMTPRHRSAARAMIGIMVLISVFLAGVVYHTYFVDPNGCSRAGSSCLSIAAAIPITALVLSIVFVPFYFIKVRSNLMRAYFGIKPPQLGIGSGPLAIENLGVMKTTPRLLTRILLRLISKGHFVIDEHYILYARVAGRSDFEYLLRAEDESAINELAEKLGQTLHVPVYVREP